MPDLIRRGSTGEKVKDIQKAINARPATGQPKLDVDGVFGEQTEAAVKQLQRRSGLIVDGIVGPKTSLAIFTRVAIVEGQLQRRDTPGTTTPAPTSNGTPVAPTPAPATPANPSGSSATTGTATTSTSAPSTAGTVIQLQPNGIASFKPWIYRGPPGSTTPGNVWSGSINLGLIYRTAKDGRHFEFGPSLQFNVNSRSQGDDPRYSFAGNVAITYADLVAPGRLHLISPFFQGSFVWNADPQSKVLGLAAGDQISVDIIEDRLSIFGQFGVVANWDLNHGAFSLGGQGVLGLTLQHDIGK
jgi:peptidoglycan hydrolase-like protein with peptidoglycan-binding domain